MWWSAGIFRDVYLMGKTRFTSRTSLCAPILTMTTSTPRSPPAGTGKSRRAAGRSDAGIRAVRRRKVLYEGATPRLSVSHLLNVDFAIDVKAPQQWSAENPWLYHL